MEMDFWPSHSKYGYNTGEQLIMLLTTGVTNVMGLPVTIYLYRMQRYFEAFIGVFTVFTSFMYHSVESVDTVFFLDEGQWHRLDNIGAITGFMMIFVYLMDNRDHYLDLQLLLGCLFIAILAQEKDPWNLFYTIVPICMACIAWLVVLKFRKRKPQFNFPIFGKSTFFLFIAACCFAVGLDEHRDYLRIYHGLWHMFVGISSFYFWQAKLVKGQELTWRNFWYKKIQPSHFYDPKSFKDDNRL